MTPQEFRYELRQALEEREKGLVSRILKGIAALLTGTKPADDKATPPFSKDTLKTMLAELEKEKTPPPPTQKPAASFKLFG